MEDFLQRSTLSDIFTYKVPKMVVLRDSWLGCLNWFSMLIIFLYFGVHEMCMKNKYLALYPLVGTTDIVYPDVQDPKPKQALPYCKNYDGNSSLVQRPCVNLPKWDIVIGSARNHAFFTTRLYDYAQYDLDCMQTAIVLQPRGESGCRHKPNGTRRFQHYVANVEYMTLAVRHQATPASHKSGKHAQSKDFKGRLHCGDELLDVGIYTASASREYDTISVNKMLSCVGVRLDDKDLDDRPFRFSGIQLVLEVDYTYDSWGNVNGYDYYLTEFPLKSFQIRQDPGMSTYADANLKYPASRRQFEGRAGVSIEIQVKGKGGAPAFDQFMVSWVSTMALMGVVPIFIGVLMHHVHPLRSLYQNIVSERSFNFTSFRNGEPQALEVANGVLHATALSRGHHRCARFSLSEEGKYEKHFVDIKTPSTHKALELRVTALEEKMNKILSPAADADTACVAIGMGDGTTESTDAQASASHLGADENQEINTCTADLEKHKAEFAAHSPRPNEAGLNEMEARVNNIQAHVTKIDGEVQRIGRMEQQFAAASNHWADTERKLAGAMARPHEADLDDMRARVKEIQAHVTKIDGKVQQIGHMEQQFAPASKHWIETERNCFRAVWSQEIITGTADFEDRMAEFVDFMTDSPHRFNLPPILNEDDIGDLGARRRDVQNTKLGGEAQQVGRMEQLAAAFKHWIETECKVAVELQQTRKSLDALTASIARKIKDCDTRLQHLHYLTGEFTRPIDNGQVKAWI